MNRNVVELSGRLVADVATRQLPSGSKVANFSVATTRFYYDKDKNKQEETVFVDCEMFGPRVDHLEERGTKGRKIFIDGRLRQDKWQDKEGGNRQKLLVVVEDFDWLTYPEQTESNEGDAGQKETPAPPRAGNRAGPSRGRTAQSGNDVKDKDIPF